MTRLLPALLLAPLLALAPAAHADSATGPLRAVPELDLARYAGTWHEIARLPNRFEDDCVSGITATYTPLSDGRIAVTNRCVEEDGEVSVAEGIARPGGTLPSQLEVRFAPKWLSFLPFVWADYWVVSLDPDYQWAIVGEPDRDYLWFLSRQPTMDAEALEDMKARARTLGYDLGELIVN